jgi:uncharacterized protein YggE
MNAQGIRRWMFALIFTIAAISPCGDAQDRNDPPDRRPPAAHRTILVTGNGEASAPPDQALVRLGMMSQQPQASVAQSKANEAIKKTIDAIEKAGVPRSAIRTTGLTLSPIYAEKLISGAMRVSAFRADNVIEVTLNDTKLIGPVIDAAINGGANEVQGVSFRLKDELPQRTDALTRAAQEAKTKAETIARALGVTLGPIFEVNESGARVIPMDSPGVAGRMMAMKSIAPTQVEPGEVRVEASVTVRYEIGAKER